MAKFARPVRVGIALVVLGVSGPIWFFLAVYSSVEQLGGRSHPVVDAFGWSALAVASAAAVVLCVEVLGAVLDRLNRRN
jgi:hypothetical protein